MAKMLRIHFWLRCKPKVASRQTPLHRILIFETAAPEPKAVDSVKAVIMEVQLMLVRIIRLVAPKIICNHAQASTKWSVGNTQTILIIELVVLIQILEAQHLAEANIISIMGKVISYPECSSRTQTTFIITEVIVTLNRTHSRHHRSEIRFICTR